MDKSFNTVFSDNRKKFINQMAPESFAFFSATDFGLLKITNRMGWQTNPEYYYLTGLDSATGFLVISKSLNGDIEECLFLPQPDPYFERWEGKIITADEASKITTIKQIKYYDKLDDYINNLAVKYNLLYIQRSNSKIEASITGYENYINKIRQAHPSINIAPASKILDKMRWVKNNYELETINKAIDITRNTLQNITDHIRPGLYEYQVEAALNYQYRYAGCQRQAFPAIVAAGINSTTLHYNEAQDKLQKNDVLLIDTGAQWQAYNADVTRVFPVGAKFTSFASDMYGINLEIQKQVIKSLAVGQTLRQVFKNTSDIQKQLLLKYKVIKKSDDYIKYTIHNVGHPMGLEVHDPFYLDLPIEVGTVLTIEPGLYFPDKKVGIRIEDDILFTKKGLDILTAAIPKEIDAIHKMLNL